ncbi:hypothetical protein [Microbacterium sp. NPDC087592]|uniref:hypothetical protein n=1 Tax=Microbacterium sp. NPDC087592 TaxID=3364193 RepID=UPI0038279E73
MAGIALVGYIVCVAAVVAVVWLVVRGRPRRTEPLAASVQSLLDAARRRAVIAVVFSGVVIVALFLAGSFLQSLAGLPIALAPALGGSAGLLLYSATPPRAVVVASGAAREASLTPRTPLSFVPPVGTGLLAAAVILQVAFLIFTGVTSSPDGSGRYRTIAFQTADSASASSPYPGWFYGVPLLVATVVLVAATFLALWRVSSTPALPQRERADVDAGWRRATNRIILAVGGAMLLLQFGGTALQSGSAMHNTYFEGVPPIWDVLGQTLAGAGLALMIGSIVVLTLATLWAFTLPDAALAAGAPAGPRNAETAPAGLPR